MISILRILYSSYKKTDNIFTSIVGEQIKDDLLNNKNSELNKSNWRNWRTDGFNFRLVWHVLGQPLQSNS